MNERPDIIIAEPVGSCTDLSATLINPIKEYDENRDLGEPSDCSC